MGGDKAIPNLFLLLCSAATFFTISLLRLPSHDGSPTPISSTATHHRLCSSCSQSPLLLPPHSPSLAFSAAWLRYQHLHLSCTASKNLTAALSSYISAAATDDNRDPCNYLVYLESRAGLGNRLLSLASAFTYALLTDRVLLIDRRQNLDSLLCEPFDATTTSWLLPLDFPYAVIDNAPTLSRIDPERIFANFRSSTPSPQPPIVLRLDLHHVRRRRDELFFCEDVQRFLGSSKWVGWTSNQYYVTEFFMIPMFFPRLDAMFPMLDEGSSARNVSSAASPTPGGGGNGVFTTLSRLLFLPSDNVWDIVLTQYNTYLADASALARVQVRLHGHRNIAGFEPSVSQKIYDCLVKVADELPDSTHEGSGAAEVAVLVASLNGGYARDLKQRYKDAAAVRVHTASTMVVQGNTEEEIRMALAEMWLLSMSDKLATSAFSTFGYIAQGLGGRKPYILNLEEGGGGKAACALGASVEPCTHYPVMLQCGRQREEEEVEMSESHAEWIAAHIRPCQDYHAGWQIVPRTSA